MKNKTIITTRMEMTKNKMRKKRGKIETTNIGKAGKSKEQDKER